MIFHNYGTCTVDQGWMIISVDDACSEAQSPGDTWTPDEGATIPQIRYATNITRNGYLINGFFSDANENQIADTMVVYVNPTDTLYFGKLFAKTSTSGQYTSIYFPYETLNWFEAKDYCMTKYGSSLASIHSSSDETELLETRWKNDVNYAWVGFNDINEESKLGDKSLENSTWQWSDGVILILHLVGLMDNLIITMGMKIVVHMDLEQTEQMIMLVGIQQWYINLFVVKQ